MSTLREFVRTVCCYRHTHDGEKWISGPPEGPGVLVSHGCCSECAAVEVKQIDELKAEAARDLRESVRRRASARRRAATGYEDMPWRKGPSGCRCHSRSEEPCAFCQRTEEDR